MSGLKYAGMTIGPIFDTISEASTPAALWLSSSIFSDITRRLCSEITSKIDGAVIYTPYYSKEIISDDGIGKFHDRIIFSGSNITKEVLGNIVKEVKAETAGRLGEKYAQDSEIKAFLETYLQVHFCILDEEEVGEKNVILTVTPYLDALELMKTFPKSNEKNPFKTIFKGGNEAKNQLIKETLIYTEIASEKNQLRKNSKENLKDIESIAANGREAAVDYKYRRYFAIVQADGDKMGEFLKNTSSNDITRFSRACLTYAEQAGEAIKKYGGVTVYAGGDDLLFIAPAKTDTSDIFSLCGEINKMFQKTVREEGFTENIPTISFGISIQYYKFPLYEALEKGRSLLFDVAKAQKNKNCMAINIAKHSGQSVSVVVDNDAAEAFKKLVFLGESYTDKNGEDEKGTANQKQNSVLYTIGKLSFLLEVAIKEILSSQMDISGLRACFDNMFDNAGQKCSKSYRNELVDIIYSDYIKSDSGIRVFEEDVNKNVFGAITASLTIAKFFEERGVEE